VPLTPFSQEMEWAYSMPLDPHGTIHNIRSATTLQQFPYCQLFFSFKPWQ